MDTARNIIVRVILLLIAFDIYAQDVGEKGEAKSAGLFASFYMKDEVLNGVPQDVVYFRRGQGHSEIPIDRAFLVSLRENKDEKAMRAWQDFLNQHPNKFSWSTDLKEGYQADRNMRVSLLTMPDGMYITGEVLMIHKSMGKAQALNYLKAIGKIRGDCSQLYQDTMEPYSSYVQRRDEKINKYAKKYYDGSLRDPLCSRQFYEEELAEMKKGIDEYIERLEYFTNQKVSLFDLIINSSYAEDNENEADTGYGAMDDEFGSGEVEDGKISTREGKRDKTTSNETDGSDTSREIAEKAEQTLEIYNVRKAQAEIFMREKCETQVCVAEKKAEIDSCDEAIREITDLTGAAQSKQLFTYLVENEEQQESNGITATEQEHMGDIPDVPIQRSIDSYNFEEAPEYGVVSEYSEGDLPSSQSDSAEAPKKREVIEPLTPLPTIKVKLDTRSLEEIAAEHIAQLEKDRRLTSTSPVSQIANADKVAAAAAIKNIPSVTESSKKNYKDITDSDKAMINAAGERQKRTFFKKHQGEEISNKVYYSSGNIDESKLNQEAYFNNFVLKGDYKDYSTINKPQAKVDAIAMDLILESTERGKNLDSEYALEIAQGYVDDNEDIVNFDRIFGEKPEVIEQDFRDEELQETARKKVEIAKQVKAIKSEVKTSGVLTAQNKQLLEEMDESRRNLDAKVADKIKNIEDRIASEESSEGDNKDRTRSIASSPNGSNRNSGARANSSSRNLGGSGSRNTVFPSNTTASYSPFPSSYADDSYQTASGNQNISSKEPVENQATNLANESLVAPENNTGPKRGIASIPQSSGITGTGNVKKSDYLKYVRYENGKYKLYAEIKNESDPKVIKENLNYLKENASEFEVVDYSNYNNPLVVRKNANGFKIENRDHKLADIMKRPVIEDYLEK
jgi:hypothetical protein